MTDTKAPSAEVLANLADRLEAPNLDICLPAAIEAAALLRTLAQPKQPPEWWLCEANENVNSDERVYFVPTHEQALEHAADGYTITPLYAAPQAPEQAALRRIVETLTGEGSDPVLTTCEREILTIARAAIEGG